MIMGIPSPEDFQNGCKEYEKHEKRDAMYKVATFLIEEYWNSPSDMADGLGVLLLTWNQSFYRYGYFDFELLEACIRENMPILEKYRRKDIQDFRFSDECEIKQVFNKFNEALRIDMLRFSDKNSGKYTDKKLAKILSRLDIDCSGNSLKELFQSIKNSKIGNAVEFTKSQKKDSIELKISELPPEEKSKFLEIDKKEKIIKRSPVSVAKALHLLAPNFFPLWDDKIARAYDCYYSLKPAESYIAFCNISKIMAQKLKGSEHRKDRTILKLIDEYNYSKYTKEWV